MSGHMNDLAPDGRTALHFPAADAYPEPERSKDALYRLTDRLHHAISLEAIYDAALEAIVGALPCDRASVLLLDEQGVMRFVAQRGLSEGYCAAVEGHSPWQPDDTQPAPVCMADIAHADLDERLQAVLAAEGIGALGFFPLIVERKLIGKFMAYWNEPRGLGDEDIALSLTIARQLGVAIARRRAEEALRISEQHLRAELADTRLLQQLSAELIDQEKVDALYEKIVDAAMIVMRSDCASMQMLDPADGGELQLLASRGFNLQAVKFWDRVNADSGSSCGAAFLAGRRVILEDVERCDFMRGTADLEVSRQAAIRAVQSTPLFARTGKLVGMISTHWREPHAPSERDLRLLDIVARQAADLIERRRARDELTALKDRLALEVQDLQRLHEFSARVMKHDKVETVLHDLMLAAAEVTRVGKAAVQMYDRRGDVLQLVSTTGLPPELTEQLRNASACGFAAAAASVRSQRTLIVEDFCTDDQLGAFAQLARSRGIRAAQSTPLFDSEGALAAVVSTYSQRPGALAERELRLLDLHAEIAVRQIERRRSEQALAFLAELSAAFAPIVSMEDIARVSGQKLRAHFGASRVCLCQVDVASDEIAVFQSDGTLHVNYTQHKLSSYLQEALIRDLEGDQVVTIPDLRADPRTPNRLQPNAGSMVLAPHIANGRWRFLLEVRKQAPQMWQAMDLALLREVAGRLHMRLERARSEEALAESEAKLREDDRRKDEFLAMLAHELRNPLAPIVNAVHLMGQHDTGDPLQQRVRAIIDRQTGRLVRLVDDLLEVSRITSGKVQLRCERIALGAAVERAIETARPLIEQRRHALKVSLPADPVWVEADATRLEQIVVNLLNNAAKYTNDGGSIQLRLEVRAHEALLHVADNGMGIEAKLLPRIFDLFTQAERSLDRSSGGMGIGLSLVKKLVSMHGGSVSVESVVGRGSVFTVRLPTAAAPAPAVKASARGAETRPVKTLRVLVVDDNIDAAQSFALMLQQTGHDVRALHDGATALEVAQHYLPNVIFLDIGLPRMDGYQVARHLRQTPALSGATLIAMTGYGLRADREQTQAAGFDHHLVKPVYFSSIEPILASVAAVVAMHDPGERASEA